MNRRSVGAWAVACAVGLVPAAASAQFQVQGQVQVQGSVQVQAPQPVVVEQPQPTYVQQPTVVQQPMVQPVAEPQAVQQFRGPGLRYGGSFLAGGFPTTNGFYPALGLNARIGYQVTNEWGIFYEITGLFGFDWRSTFSLQGIITNDIMAQVNFGPAFAAFGAGVGTLYSFGCPAGSIYCYEATLWGPQVAGRIGLDLLTVTGMRHTRALSLAFDIRPGMYFGATTLGFAFPMNISLGYEWY